MITPVAAIVISKLMEIRCLFNIIPNYSTFPPYLINLKFRCGNVHFIETGSAETEECDCQINLLHYKYLKKIQTLEM